MKHGIILAAALAGALGSAAPAATAAPVIDCTTLTTIAEWGAARACVIGETIFSLGRSRGDANPILVDFDLLNGVVLLKTSSPDGSPLRSAFSYSLLFQPGSAARVVEVQLFGIRQPGAAPDQGGAFLSAFTDPDPIALPTLLELTIGNNELTIAAPDPRGAPPPPPDPALFDSGAIDARTLQVTTQFNARGNGRDGLFGLDSVTTVYVLADFQVAVPAPASLALLATGLAMGAAFRRRRR